MNDALRRVAARIEASRDFAIEAQTRLTAVPAIAPEAGGEGELRKALVVEELLRAIGVSDIERIDAPDARAHGGVRPNVVARIPGAAPASEVGRLWIMSHLDVVAEGDRAKWTGDPWTLRVEGDKLFGRGVEDNQQGIVASLVLARALLEERVVPARDVCLLFVADEEVGSAHGIQYLLAQRPHDLFTPKDLIVVPDGGRPDGSQIEVAEKSIVWFKICVVGKSTHASTPERGVNAHRAAAHLVVALDELHRTFAAVDPVFDPPVSTFEPTKREPNVGSVNILPGEDVFYLDCRVLPRYSLADVEAEVARHCKSVEERFGVAISFETPQREVAAPPTSADAPVVVKLVRAVEQVYGVLAKPEGIGGGTVAAYIRHAGYPAVVWARMDETMHTADEYVLVPNILGDAKVFAHLALG
jgi:succinyl-diaminopimelate desuccinylase